MALGNTLRYQRQIALPEIGEVGQAKLRAAKILVIGAGGLGSPASIYLAAAGVGKLGIIDGDRVDRSNLHRQILFGDEHVGELKAQAAQISLQRINPDCQLQVYPHFITAANAKRVIEPYDLVLDGSDNFSTRYLVNDACVELDKPFIGASVFRFEGQLSLFNAKLGSDRGPTYRCLFPEPPSLEEAPNCAQNGILGSVAGVVGVLQAHEALKFILGFGEPLIGKLAVIDLLTSNMRHLLFERHTEARASSKLRDDSYYLGLMGACMQTAVKDLEPRSLKDWQSEGRSFFLLDVREPVERAQRSIGGVHIPLGDLSSRMSEINTKDPIVVYCHSGVRSNRAAEMIINALGVGEIYNLKGGIVACEGVL